MSPAWNAILGTVFVSVGAVATVLMLAVRGRPSRPASAERSRAPDTAAGRSAATRADQPRIAGRKPMRVKLERGEYHWCACGHSQAQPFCDGSHRGTPFQPLAFHLEEDKTVSLCLCKQTQNPPYCDGSHNRLAETDDDAAPQAAPQTDVAAAPQPRNTTEEPTLELIHSLARDGLAKVGHHGPVGAMGVPRHLLPHWDDIQILPAQLATRPLPEDAPVGTELVIGPGARRPLRLEIPLLVSDMSFGALSQEAKVALARGAERAGTGICSGEGGMLPEEQAENSRYFYELASARFGYSEALLAQVQAFHFKAGQGAKTGTGGHLPGGKVTAKIAQVRGLPVGEPAVSPPTFVDLVTPDDFRQFADHVRALTGGIPIGMKLSAQHIERDVEFALQVGVDYLILDGRGGGTGAAPLLFRDHISVPTIAALARVRRYLDQQGRTDVTLIVTGGLRTPADFVKALCLGADGVALATAAMQAIGCVAARMCHTNNCPAGIATQREELRARVHVQEGAERLARFLTASTQLMQVMARACGHAHLREFCRDDLCAWKRDVADLAGVRFAGP